MDCQSLEWYLQRGIEIPKLNTYLNSYQRTNSNHLPGAAADKDISPKCKIINPDISEWYTIDEICDEKQNSHLPLCLNLKSKSTPLHEAIKNRYYSMAKFFIDIGVNLDARDCLGKTPLYLAVELGDTNTLDYLIKNKASINSRYSKGQTALQLSFKKEKLNCFTMLLESGADVNSLDDYKMNILHYVARTGYVHIASKLIMHGCNINATNICGISPLNMAILMNQPEMVGCLMNHGAFTAKISKVLARSIKQKHNGVVNALIANGISPNAIVQSGDSLLNVAVQYDNIEITEYLLKQGANPNVIGASGKPAVTEAICAGKVDLLRLLINKQANLCLKDNTGKSPLYYAINQENLEIKKIIVDTGINKDAGETCKRISRVSKRKRLTRRLSRKL